MKPKWWVLAIGLLVLASVGVFLAASGSRRTQLPDPVIQGQPISVWVNRALSTGAYQDTQKLRELGPEVVPHLTQALKRRSTQGNSAWVKIWPFLPNRIQQRLNPPVLAREIRLRAVVALREIGPSGKAGIPALIERLGDPDRQIRLHAAISLGEFGQDSTSALPRLEPFLKDESHTVRVYSANAIWKITHKPEPVLTVLEEGLKDKKAGFRWAAAVFLGEMGSAAERAIPLLEQATKDSDKEVASLAIQALAEISPKTFPVITNLLSDPDPNIRISACAALGKIGPAAKAAVPLLVKATEDRATGSPAIMGRPVGAESVRDRALAVLEKLDPEARKGASQE
jgi:HEAT repeat protein